MVMLVKHNGENGDSNLGFEIDLSTAPTRREALAQVSQPVIGIHDRAKNISPDLVQQAINNEPFEDYPRAVYSYKHMYGEDGGTKRRFKESYRPMVEKFLRSSFHTLAFMPEISFDIGNISEKDEEKALNASNSRYRDANMQGQVTTLTEAYDNLRALRAVFGNPTIENDFGLETVIPSRYLPELLVAAPVWFIEPKVKPKQKSGGSRNQIVRHFCDLGVTDEFAHLFQMYNRVPRYFDEFRGADVMPLNIAELVGELKQVFDYLVIATPYHDLASKEWREARWLRNPDPFLFGFLKQVPQMMFFLGRWSGTGLFPLMGNMIADTVQHIDSNKHLLRNFYQGIPWYKGGAATWSGSEGLKVGSHNREHVLVEYADSFIRKFRQGNLFSWLRGEVQTT